MENLWNKPPRSWSLIKGIFILISFVSLSIFILLLVLNIHETVKFRSGEIFSMNPSIEYKATHEAKVKSIHVKEGKAVNAGDTLLILENESLITEYNKAKEDYFLTLINLDLQRKQLENLQKKVDHSQAYEKVITSELSFNRKKATIEIEALKSQIEMIKEKLNISETRLQKDKQLLAEGIISEEVFEGKQQSYLEELNGLSQLQKQYEQQFTDKGLFKNQYADKKQQIQSDVLNLEHEIIEIKKTIFQQESSLQNLGNQMQFLGEELQKLVVIAERSGTVFGLFNEKRASNFIPKGSHLLTLKPTEEERFYAKVPISQESVAKVRAGQQAHLKIKAFNYYQYGIVKGTVNQVARIDTSDQFIALIDIPKVPEAFQLKSGYEVKGNIILERVKLYRYIASDMLQK